LERLFDDGDPGVAIADDAGSPGSDDEEGPAGVGLEGVFDDVDVELAVAEELRPPEAEPEEESGELDDVERFSQLAEVVLEEFADSCAQEWEESPFAGIRRVPSSHKRGKMGEALVRKWARGEGLTVDEAEHRGYDCAIDGLKVEVKTSLRWNSQRFVFLQLRDFTYEAIALLGLGPQEVRLWIVPKRVLWQCARMQTKGVSHHGSKWVSFIVGATPEWLAPWGGTLDEARDALMRIREEPERWGTERVVYDSDVDILSQVSAPPASAF
jgi:hypothetical protein